MQITIREPGSAITHFIAMMMAVFAAVPLLVKAGVQSGQENFLAMAIFMGSMILLYGASATYHSVDLTGKSLRVFRKLDHVDPRIFRRNKSTAAVCGPIVHQYNLKIADGLSLKT